MTSIVQVTTSDYGETNDQTFEFYGPFRDHEKARDLAAKINARLDRDNSATVNGAVNAEAVRLGEPKINTIVAQAKAWLKEMRG